MAKSKLLAAALLKDELDEDDKIHAALFSVAFEELDDLRKKLAQIPLDVDASASRFQKITTQAVDDFVTVANEALSKFMQRTKEMSATLDAIERAGRGVVAPPTPAPAVAAVAPQIQATNNANNATLWVIIPAVVFVGILIGATVAYFVLK